MDKKPHIIIFNVDQWRGDVLGHLGNPAADTPNLDQLVRNDAVSFSNAFCQNPVCTPSRCSFMTGWYPHVRGHRTMFHMLHQDRDEPNLLKILKDNGFDVTQNFSITGDDLKTEIEYFDGVVVRSRTKLTAELLENAKNLKVIGLQTHLKFTAIFQNYMNGIWEMTYIPYPLRWALLPVATTNVPGVPSLLKK